MGLERRTYENLYIPSLQSFSGKTAVCLALGRRLQQDGYRVGYFKPLSTQAWEPIPGQTPDEDADFVRQVLGLEETTEALIGLRLTPSILRDTPLRLSGTGLADGGARGV